MSIELDKDANSWGLAVVTKLIKCGYGRHPNGLDIQLCPETLVVHSDGSWLHQPLGMPETEAYMNEKAALEYGRCREHGRVAVHNAIPPRQK